MKTYIRWKVVYKQNGSIRYDSTFANHEWILGEWYKAEDQSLLSVSEAQVGFHVWSTEKHAQIYANRIPNNPVVVAVEVHGFKGKTDSGIEIWEYCRIVDIKFFNVKNNKLRHMRRQAEINDIFLGVYTKSSTIESLLYSRGIQYRVLPQEPRKEVFVRAAEEQAQKSWVFACYNIGRAYNKVYFNCNDGGMPADICIKKWSPEYKMFVEYFKPDAVVVENAWWTSDNNEARILALLLCAEMCER